MSNSTAERFWSKVDKTEGCWLWVGTITDRGYGRIRVDGRYLLAHRFSYEATNGPIPTGLEIDHICHTTNCVRPNHLRVVTRKQNIENRSGLQRTNTSGVTGVYWRANRWQAVVRHNKGTYYLGRFVDLAEAAEAVRAKRNELFTHNDIDRVA